MTLFLWKKSYEVGIPEIDAQHRRLVSLINELSDSMMDQKGHRRVPHILDSLMDYIQLHFAEEEAAMQGHGYPGFYKHSHNHLELTRKVLDFRETIRAGQEVKAKELLDFLCSWLKDHIMVEDKGFGAFVRRLESGDR